MTAVNFKDFSDDTHYFENPASNTTIFQGTQYLADFDDEMRNVLGAFKRDFNRSKPVKTSTGSADAYELTYDVTDVAGYVQGTIYSFVANFTNAGSPTLDVNSIGAKTIKYGTAELSGGEIVEEYMISVAYDAANDVFQLLTTPANFTSAYVEVAGDTMTGQLFADPNSAGIDASLSNAGLNTDGLRIINGDDTLRFIDFCTLGGTGGDGLCRRFEITLTDEAESGSDAGSNLAINRYDDEDTFIDECLSINRATGVFDFNSHRLSGVGTPTADSDATPKTYVDTRCLVGEIKFYGSASVPDGWLACDGTAVSRSTYSDLFAVIGTSYGVGDGSTTFNVPDMSGRFAVGTGDSSTTGSSSISLGDSDGTAKHQLTEDELAAHTHTGGVANYIGAQSTGGSAPHGPTTTTGSTGGDVAHENMPPYVGFNCIIFAGV